MSCDPNFSTTSLLLHCDGTNNSTTFTDETGKTITAVGNAKISTTQSKFGGASALFDGSGDYLNCGDHADFELGSGDFTMECFVRFAGYPNGYSGAYRVALIGKDAVGARSFHWGVTGTVSSFTGMVFSTAGTEVSVSWAPALNTWYHLAVCKSGTSLRFFVDGTQVGTTQTHSTAIADVATALTIGGILYTGFQYYLNGYVDEVRITKGAARYTADFTAPTAALPDHQCTISGVVGSPGAYQERTIYVQREDTGALVGSGTSSSVDGTYSVPVTHTGECIVTATHPTNHPLIHSRVVPV